MKKDKIYPYCIILNCMIGIFYVNKCKSFGYIKYFSYLCTIIKNRTIMKQELISVVKSFISNDEIEYTFSKMCIERVPLHYANNTLYNKLSDLVDDFIADNDLQDDWFEKTFLGIDDLFEYLID